MLVNEGEELTKKLESDIEVLNRIYPEIKIHFVKETGELTPKKIEEHSRGWNIPTNYMFIGAPGPKFPY